LPPTLERPVAITGVEQAIVLLLGGEPLGES
jgi:hypothetical protein